MYYALFYETVDNYVERRAPYREQHLAHATAAHERGELVLAGAFGEPPDGALLVFAGDSPAVAEEFARNDPYVQNGCITKWTVRPWVVVIGG
jgi:uncharacterized protein YciI